MHFFYTWRVLGVMLARNMMTARWTALVIGIGILGTPVTGEVYAWSHGRTTGTFEPVLELARGGAR